MMSADNTGYSWVLALAALILLGFLVMSIALGAPPEGADPNSPIGRWFQSLKQPDTQVSCCSVADCRPTDYRMKDDHYEVQIAGEWLPVPPEKVLHRENILGRAVLCRSPITGTIYCFLPASEG